MNRRITKKQKRSLQAGYALVVTALLLVVFMGFLTLAIDLAFIYIVRFDLQKASDAVSLGAMEAFIKNISALDPVKESATIEQNTRAAAREIAERNENRPIGQPQTLQVNDADIHLGTWDFNNRTFVDNADLRQVNAIRVLLGKGQGWLNPRASLFFFNAFQALLNQVVGIDPSTISTEATATAIPRRIMIALDTSGSMDQQKYENPQTGYGPRSNTSPFICCGSELTPTTYQTESFVVRPAADIELTVHAQTISVASQEAALFGRTYSYIRPEPIATAVLAARQFIDTLDNQLNSQDQAGYLTFSTGHFLHYPQNPVAQTDYAELRRVIRILDRDDLVATTVSYDHYRLATGAFDPVTEQHSEASLPWGFTNHQGAIRGSLTALANMAQGQSYDVIILLSDGESTAYRDGGGNLIASNTDHNIRAAARQAAYDAARDAFNQQVTIHTIALANLSGNFDNIRDAINDPSTPPNTRIYLQTMLAIAEVTGGMAQVVNINDDINRVAEVVQNAFDQIAARIPYALVN